MKILFHKYQGTGNDFVILDNYTSVAPTLTTAQVKKICDRRFGVGGDGLMILSKKEGYDFEMIYYNADGNESSMCGNGGRCLTKFAADRGIHRNIYQFLAVDGDHQSEIEMDGRVRLKMKDVITVEQHDSYALLDTGSPHYVKFLTDVKEMDVVTKGREIRNSKAFKAEGINVNFVETTSQDHIYVRTYERGVEAETFSCGTGVTAAALISAHNDRGFNRVEVKTPGGNLCVEFDKKADKHFENIWLCGPAVFVFKGEIEIHD